MTTDITDNPITFSKQQLAFFRKLYLAYLIDTESHNLLSLVATTGMPRRTIQDCLKVLKDVGIDCVFVDTAGTRHNDGFYQIRTWGAINQQWVADNIVMIKTGLGLPS